MQNIRIYTYITNRTEFENGFEILKILDAEFSEVLSTPQTPIPILKPSEGVSPRSVIMRFELIMEQTKL